MIERGTGPVAMQRAVLHGLAAGLVGAALLGAAVMVFPFVRIFLVVAIGYAVGKRTMAAVDGYGGHRYQILAVALTYFAVGLSSLAPAFQEAREAEARRKAIAADTSRMLATQGRAINEELKAPGLLCFGYALYQAWKLTDGQGLDLQLKGPFRVGTGPIQPAF